jgi:hypothetical protein
MSLDEDGYVDDGGPIPCEYDYYDELQRLCHCLSTDNVIYEPGVGFRCSVHSGEKRRREVRDGSK